MPLTRDAVNDEDRTNKTSAEAVSRPKVARSGFEYVPQPLDCERL